MGSFMEKFSKKKVKEKLKFMSKFSIIAMIISIGMFAEQWWIWIIVDVVTIYMWFLNFQQGNENIATLIMWCVYLLNAIFMCYKWEINIKIQKGAINTKFNI